LYVNTFSTIGELVIRYVIILSSKAKGVTAKMDGVLTLDTDAFCIQETLSIEAESILSTKTNQDIIYTGADINIIATSTALNSGTGAISMIERCAWTGTINEAVVVGGEDTNKGVFTLTNTELKTLHASSITLTSMHGSVRVNGMKQARDLPNVSGIVTINSPNSSGTIEFNGDTNQFTALQATGLSGINVIYDLSTTAGNLGLTFNTGNLLVVADKIKSIGGTINLVSSSSRIKLIAPIEISSADYPWTLKVPTDITRTAGSHRVAKFHSTEAFSLENKIEYVSTTTILRNTLLFESKNLNLNHPTARIIADDIQDDVVLRSQVSGSTMLLGTHDTPGIHWHLTDAEIGKIIASGRLYIGDYDTNGMLSSMVDSIKLSDVSITTGNYGIFIQANFPNNGEISLETTGSTFAYETTLTARRSLNLNAALESAAELHLYASDQCTRFQNGGLSLGADAFVDGQSNINVNAEDIMITNNAILKSATKLYVYERCSNEPIDSNPSISIGANASGFLSLNKAELSTLGAQEIHFVSMLGDIEIKALTQTTDMSSISGGVFFNADFPSRSVSFMGESSFKQLDVSSANGIEINEDISTTDGHMHLTVSSNDIKLISNIEKLESKGGDMKFQSSDMLSKIKATGNLTLKSVDDTVYLSIPVELTRTENARLTLFGEKDLICSKGVSLIGKGYSGTGIDIRAGQIDLQAGCSISANLSTDDLTMKSTCNTGNCEMYFGDLSPDAAEFHLTQIEFDRITSSGSLKIGDESYGGSPITTLIEFGELRISTGLQVILASRAVNAIVKVSSGRLNVSSSLWIYSSLGLSIDDSSTLEGESTVFITIDESSCEATSSITLGDGSALKSGGDLTIYSVQINIHENAHVDAKTYALRFSERCYEGKSIGLGQLLGSQLNQYKMVLQKTELETLTAASLLIDSKLGGGLIKGIIESTYLPSIMGKLSVTFLAQTQDLIFEDECVFKTFEATVDGAVTIPMDLSSNTGDFTINFDGNMGISAGVTLTSPKNLNLLKITDSATSILASNPFSVIATSGVFRLGSLLTVTRNNGATSQPENDLYMNVESFDCEKPIAFTGASNIVGARMRLRATIVDLAEACTMSAGIASDEIHLETTCIGKSCTMDFGALPNPSAYHITSSEFTGIATMGKLRIGEITTAALGGVIAKLRFKDITYTSGNAGIFLRALHQNGQLKMIGINSLRHTVTTEIAGNLQIDPYSSLTLIDGSSYINLDMTCSNRGLTISSGASLSTVNQDLQLTLGQIELSGSLSSGSGNLKLFEPCINGDERSLTIGGTTDHGLFVLTKNELGMVTSADLTMTSIAGGVDLRGLSHSSDISGTSGTIILNAAKKVHAQSSANKFKSLTATGSTGMIIDTDLSTSTGAMALYFNGLYLAKNVVLDAKTTLSLTTTSTGITAQAPGMIRGDIVTISVDMEIIRSYEGDAYTFYAESNLAIDKEVTMSGSSGPYRQPLYLTAAIIDIDTISGSVTMDNALDDLVLKPKCSSRTCVIIIGDATGEESGYHLAQDETEKMAIAGRLYVGDYESTRDVGTIKINSWTPSSTVAAGGIFIVADHIEAAEGIAFNGQQSLFQVNTVLQSSSDVNVAGITKTQSASYQIFSDHDCSMAGTFTTSAAVKATNGNLTAYLGATSLGDALAATNARLRLVESCSSKDSLGIGGTTEGNDNLRLSRSELQQLEANSLVLTSLLGKIEAYGQDASDTNSIIDLVSLQTQKTLQFTTHPSAFKTLSAEAAGGITIMSPASPLSTTVGDLGLTFNHGHLSINAASLTSPSTILFSSSESKRVLLQTPSTWTTAGNLVLDTPIEITRNPDGSSAFTLDVTEKITCSKSITFKDSSIGITDLFITADDMDLQSGCSFTANSSSDRVTIQPSGYSGDFDMYLGSYLELPNKFQMTDSELSMFTISGVLYIGETSTSAIIKNIYLNSVTYNSASSGIYITAREPTEGAVFFDEDTSFASACTIRSIL
jgi:hypothetical protein